LYLPEDRGSVVALKELQALVEDLSARIGAPAVLEDHEQRMVVYSAQEGPIDEVRRDSILMRDTRPAVKDWFRQFGIAHASSPLRIPSHPELGILGRLCVPVRFRGRLLGFLFLIDDVRRLDGPDVELAERVSRDAGLLLYEEELDRRLSASVRPRPRWGPGVPAAGRPVAADRAGRPVAAGPPDAGYFVKCQYSGRNVYSGSNVTPCRLLLTASMK
jgi:hypothetical protein